MTLEAQLVAAVGVLWTALSALAGGVIRYLVTDRKTREAEWASRLAADETRCNERIAKLEAKLDESAGLVVRQNVAMQKQLDAQHEMIATLQAALRKGAGA